MRTAIYGAGSVGSSLGAHIAKAGSPVEHVNRNPEHVRALREHGARVEGTMQLTVPVSAITPDAMQGPYDIVFLTTKQLDNPAVCAFLAPMLAPEGVICTLQNGLPEPGIAEIVGEAHVLGCAVEWGATLTGPGVSRLTSEPDSLSFGLGGMPGHSKRMLAETKRVLETMCPVNV